MAADGPTEIGAKCGKCAGGGGGTVRGIAIDGGCQGPTNL
jgi:hypothetical protein